MPKDRIRLYQLPFIFGSGHDDRYRQDRIKIHVLNSVARYGAFETLC